MENFYLIYGPERSLIRQKETEIIEKSNLEPSGIIRYSLSKNTMEDILEDASTVGMFTSKKIIIVEDSLIFTSSKEKKEEAELLSNYLENYNKDTTLIFELSESKIDLRKKITKEFQKKGKIIEQKIEELKNIPDYIMQYLKKDDYTLQGIDANTIAKRLGNNLELIYNELDKLKLYRLDTKIITKEDIETLTISSSVEEIFDLTDAVMKGDLKKSLLLLEKFLITNYEEIQIIILLANQFRFLFQVKRLYQQGKQQDEIAKILAAHPYRVKLAIQSSYYYTTTDLLNYLKKLSDLDKNIKLGNIDKRLGLELFILKKDMETLN